MAESLSSRMARVIFQDYIECGMLGPGDALPSIRELKQMYGASVTTLAHALGQLEAKGYIQKFAGRGSFVTIDLNESAPESTSRVLGFVATSPATSELMGQLYEGVQQGAKIHGCRLYSSGFNPTYEAEKEQVERLIADGCDAIILNPITRFYDQIEEDYLIHADLNVPIVLVDLALPEHKRVQVLFDNRTLGYDMTRMLLAAGHHNIAFAHPLFSNREVIHRSIAERRRGYLVALKECGRIPRPEDNWSMYSTGPPALDVLGNPTPVVFELLERVWAQPEPATAVLAYTDILATAMILAAQELGIKIPEGLRVVGFDNMAQGQLIRPPYPTSNPDFAYAGKMAVELALRWLAGELESPLTYMIPVPILRRDKVGNAQNRANSLKSASL